MPKTICLLVLLAAVSTVTAQTYKWRDAGGNVQYSDMPPPSNAKDVQQLRRAPGPASSGAPAVQPKPIADQEAEFRKRLAAKQDAEAKQAKAQEEAQVRARNCEQAKSQLATLEAGVRVSRFNEKGERVTLEDADRERMKAEAQKAVDTWCK